MCAKTNDSTQMENKEITISLAGSGNIAWHLADALEHAGFTLDYIYARNAKTGNEIAEEFNFKYTDNIRDLRDSEIILLCVPDTAIKELAAELVGCNKLVVHTSGATSINVLGEIKRQGVFYPTQSFSREKQVVFSQIPVLLETNNPEDYKLLNIVANELTDKVQKADSKERLYLHLAAVFACNFATTFFAISKELLEQNTSLDFKLLIPLIEETAGKIRYLDPVKSYTGPAVRKDTDTLEKHLELLSGNQELTDLYNLFTRKIQEQSGVL